MLTLLNDSALINIVGGKLRLLLAHSRQTRDAESLL